MKIISNGFSYNKVFKILLLLFFASNNIVFAQSESSDFKPSGKIWGVIFGDMIYKAQGDTLNFGKSEFAKEEEGVIGGKLRRVYFGYDYNLSEQWFVRILFEGSSGITSTQGDFTTKIKLGYLQYKFKENNLFPNAKMNVGLIPTPIFAFPEKAWGYRSIEKEALDLRGLGNSADQGASFESTFTKKGNSGYIIMLSNGYGTKPITSKNLQYDLSLYTNLLKNKLKLEFFANYFKNANDLQKTVTRGFASYSTDKFRLGFEVSKLFLEEMGMVQDVKQVKQLQPSIVSTFISPRIRDNIWAFLRYDYFNPDSNYDSNFTYVNISENYNENLFIAGFQLEIHNKLEHKIQISPNIYVNAYERKNNSFVNRKSDVVLRMTLYYNF